jgi:hypothetical protein
MVSVTKAKPQGEAGERKRGRDAGEVAGHRGHGERDDPRGDRAYLHHDGLQAQVLGPPHRRGLLPLLGPRAELGDREEVF